MFPKTFTDKTECLQSLIGVRTGCSVDKQYPFWIEDIEGVDINKLSSMTKASNNNGKDFANQIINKAARQMLGDVELLLNNGYRMNNIIGDACSTCSLLPTYTANTGIIVKSVIATRFQILRITKLTILANVTGDKVVRIDDGVTTTDYSVSLIAGTLMPVILNYATTEKSIKIYFTDNTVPLGLISCPTSNSCGCGGSANSNNPVNISGLANGLEVSTQYGFLPCVSITCSYDSLVCNLVNQTPNIFGLALFYKTAELYFDEANVSDRNNDSVAFNGEEETEQKKNYGRLYWAKMKGTGGMAGVNKIINDYLRTYRADKCVICDSKLATSYTTG